MCMYTEGHTFILEFPIPINTTGVILVFSLSTFVTPFADSEKSGFLINNYCIEFDPYHQHMYLVLSLLSLEARICGLCPATYMPLSHSQTLHGAAPAVRGAGPSSPSLALMLSGGCPPNAHRADPPARNLGPGRAAPSRDTLHTLRAPLPTPGMWTAPAELPLCGDASSCPDPRDTLGRRVPHPSAHTCLTLPYPVIFFSVVQERKRKKVCF